MLRISKIGDYAIVIMLDLCDASREHRRNARIISERTHLPHATVSKVLKLLQKGSLVDATRGLCGGYQLLDTPENIPLLSIIECIDGPLSLTTCSVTTSIDCQTHSVCKAGPHWPVINQALVQVLNGIKLSDLLNSPAPQTVLQGAASTSLV